VRSRCTTARLPCRSWNRASRRRSQPWGAAQQQMERWRGERLMEPAGNLVSEQQEVGEAMPRPWPATQLRQAVDGGQTARVADPLLADDTEAEGPQRTQPERHGDGRRSQHHPGPPDHRAVGGFDPEQCMGEGEHRPRHRAAFSAVGIEQRLRRDALRGQPELPAQIDRILDAAVHALGTRRAVDVGGVAGEERAAGPEGRRQPMLQGDLHRPGHLTGPDPPAAGQLDDGPDVVGGRRAGGGVPAGLDAQQPPPGLLADGHEDEDALPADEHMRCPVGRSPSRSMSASSTELR
jgi:hypothetical protein